MFNHFSKASASIWPSNTGISKLTCTLNGGALPEWPLDVDAFDVVGNRQRIWEKLSIISFRYRVRASSNNNLIGSPAWSSLVSSAMCGHRARRGTSFRGSVNCMPNSLYPDLVGDMHREISKDERTALIPLIRIYVGMKWNTKISWKHKDTIEP